jgi:quinoprotein glucose dehydrogenase
VYATNAGTFGWMEEAEDGADLPYVKRGPRPGNFEVNLNGQRMPCQKPPWGQLTAVDSTTGDIVWREPIGITESLPAGKQNTGRPGRAAALVTGSNLLFIASTDDNRLRALESSSGRQLWVTELENRGNANPMTYMGSDGNQYLVIAASNSLVTFKLSD